MPRARPLCASMSVGLKRISNDDAENLFVSGRGAGFYVVSRRLGVDAALISYCTELSSVEFLTVVGLVVLFGACAAIVLGGLSMLFSAVAILSLNGRER